MDYGYLKFKAQNGKSGIFWEQDKKKPERKFGYKRKDQRFSLRTNPHNVVELEPEPIKDEDSTPKPNFIERNRQLAASKNKGKKPTLRPIKKSPTGTVTLTQDQLNAILASVGKVASGEEDNLRISIDSKKNSITIESPRKSRDGDYFDHNSAESGYDDDDVKYNNDKKDKVKTKTKNVSPRDEDTTTTIFSLLEEFKLEENKPTKSTKKELTEDKNKKRDRKKVDDEKDYDSDRENVKERRGRKKETSRETKRDQEIHSKNRDRSSERDKSRKRDGSQSREHDRRRRRNDSENERDDRDISPERKSKNYRDKNESYENRKNKSKNRENDRHRVSENESDKKEETVEKKVVTPREIAGIPMSLPWKHMTLGERRRLMLARIEAEAAIKEIEKKKYELEEQKKREDNYSERKEHERNDREREKKDRHRKDKDRYDHDNGQKDRERDRNNHHDDQDDYRSRRRERDRNNHRNDDDDDHDYHSSRRKKKTSRERRRQYSPEEQDSDDDYDRDRRKKDSRSHRRNDSPELREKKHRDRRRERTPSDDEQRNHKAAEKSPERADSKPPTGLPPAPKTLTLAERKKLQWEKDRIELAKQYDPWGRPGAGAPIRTRSGNVAADYKTRQEETLRASFEEIEKKKQEQKEALILEMEKGESQPKVNASQQNVPHAMRSSFMFGQVAPDSDQFENAKEMERRKWLEELDKQNEEKRLRQLNNKANNATQETWADKFTSNHKPAGVPEQLKEPPSGYQDPYSPRNKALDGGRVNSAPTHVPDTDEDKTYIRGQNVFIDPVTRQELEEKRKRLLEHQQAVMEQVQQKQREKQRERELKMKEDMEEERKLQAERDRIQRQFEQEQNKIKMKEAKRQQEVDKLKMAMDEAHETALREKISRRLQHLDEGGHDTSHLKATLQAKLTPRNNNPSTYVQPEYVPGLNLELSPRTGPTHRSHREALIVDNPPYTENRVLTPSQFRHGNDASRDFGTQTGMGHYTPPVSDDKTVIDTDLYEKVEFGTNTDLGTNREESEVQIMYNAQGKRVRVKSAAKEETKKYQRKPEPPVEKKSKARTKEEKEKEKPKWNFQNKRRKKPVKQSEKDLNFTEKRKQSEMRRLKREQELLNLVNMNRDRIPTERPKGATCNSRGHSPASDHEGHRSRSIERFNASRRSKSHSPENVSARRNQTYRTYSPNLTQRSSSPGQKVVAPINSSHNTARGRSPPVPALRYKKDNAYDVQLAEKSARKYADNDPLDVPLTDGNFVPFLRTVEVLDPARAGSPLHISREPTAIVNARKAYIKGLKPGEYGKKAEPYEDRLKVQGEEKSKDPIMNPALVTDHPTHRQDAILQQLSSLKMNLMQRRRELETFSPTDFE